LGDTDRGVLQKLRLATDLKKIREGTVMEEKTIDDICGQLSRIVNGLPGWCSAEKAQWLAAQIMVEQKKIVVEIGVFGARSLIPMAIAQLWSNGHYPERRGFVLGIDPYDSTFSIEEEIDPENRRWWTDVNYEAVYHTALREIRVRNLDSVCGILRAASHHCQCLFREGTIDLLHIDGCHSEFASTRDVEQWLPKVKTEGLIVLDDIDWPSVQKARRILREWCQPVYSDQKWEAYKMQL
jgi:predicted O-methyltransferase YrrM